MTEESLDDPIRETHGHFDGLLRLVSASALQVTDRQAQRRLYGAHLGRGPEGELAASRDAVAGPVKGRGAHPAGSALVTSEEASTTTSRLYDAHRANGVERA